MRSGRCWRAEEAARVGVHGEVEGESEEGEDEEGEEDGFGFHGIP